MVILLGAVCVQATNIQYGVTSQLYGGAARGAFAQYKNLKLRKEVKESEKDDIDSRSLWNDFGFAGWLNDGGLQE